MEMEVLLTMGFSSPMPERVVSGSLSALCKRVEFCHESLIHDSRSLCATAKEKVDRKVEPILSSSVSKSVMYCKNVRQKTLHDVQLQQAHAHQSSSQLPRAATPLLQKQNGEPETLKGQQGQFAGRKPFFADSQGSKK